MSGIRQIKSDLPPRTYLKHGAYYYVHKETGKWTRLSEDKMEAIRLAKALNNNRALPSNQQHKKPSYNLSASHVTTVREGFIQLRMAIKMYRSAKNGASKRGLSFELSQQNVIDLLILAQGRCMATGIEFSDDKEPNVRLALWQPSIDRINSNKGYTPENIRIVCLAFNISIQNFGDITYKKIAESYLKTSLRSKNREQEGGHESE